MSEAKFWNLIFWRSDGLSGPNVSKLHASDVLQDLSIFFSIHFDTKMSKQVNLCITAARNNNIYFQGYVFIFLFSIYLSIFLQLIIVKF